MYEFIPQKLKKLKNWVCWKAIPDEKSHSGISKIPVNPYTGGMAQSNNPSTWSDFETAVRVSVDFAGIGFMFANGYFGVDLDDINNDVEDFKNGNHDNIIGEFVDTLQSYTELSFSGNGIHIICEGKLPEGHRRKNKVEMYDTGRFFVMTGNYCSEYIEINECTELIKPLHAKYLGGKDVKNKTLQKCSVSPISLSNISDIVEKAKSSKSGNKFDALYNGDFSGYTSQSEADMAFCNMLAFWCRCDIDLMDQVYRSSGLMRDKWDRKQSGSTYGIITLQKAIDNCGEMYQPSHKSNFDLDDDYDISISSSKKEKNGTNSYDMSKYYSFDDTGNADRMKDAYGDILRYSYVDKRWLFWNKGKWNYDNIGQVFRVADAILDVMKKEGEVLYPEWKDEDLHKVWKKHFTKTRSNNSKKAMVKELEHRVPILPGNLDTEKFSVNCPNGIIELKNGNLSEHDKKRYMTKMISVPYVPNAPDPLKWFKFLDDIFSGNKELIRYVQKATGYCLSGSTNEQCVFFLLGSGRNGKSTFLEVIRYIFGDYATNIQPDTIMIKKSNGSANSDIARLKGARLVTSVEPNEGSRLDEGLVKQLTGGDIVTARKLYGDEFEFKPEFKLWMATNHKPVIRGTDTGIWRRIHLIPFNVQIPENKVDKNLKYILHKEIKGILKWMVDGYALWQTEGLQMPACMVESVKEYRHEMDVISGFIDACCVVDARGESKANQLYMVYREWAETDNEYVMSNTKFGIEISKRFEKVRTKEGLVYKGIKLIKSYTNRNPYSISIG